MATYVVAGFKVEKVRSVHFATTYGIAACLRALQRAFGSKDADFVSIRRIKDEATKRED